MSAVVDSSYTLYVLVAATASLLSVVIKGLFDRGTRRAESTDIYSAVWERSMKQMSEQMNRMSARVLELEQDIKTQRYQFEARENELVTEITGLKAKVTLLESQVGQRRRED